MSAVAAPGRAPAPALIGSAADLIAGHQLRFKAGVAGCSCGEELWETGAPPLTLHALHLAPLLVIQTLRASAAALRGALPAGEADAAVSVLAGMVRHKSNTPDGRHDHGNP